jgi:energy-coupling factor transporter ATP-binding protein EcfA2
VILLDELSLGLVPLLIEEIFGMVKRLRDERNLTVLLVEQNAALALDIADHSYVMKTVASCWKDEPRGCARIPISESSTRSQRSRRPQILPRPQKLQAAQTPAVVS